MIAAYLQHRKMEDVSIKAGPETAPEQPACENLTSLKFRVFPNEFQICLPQKLHRVATSVKDVMDHLRLIHLVGLFHRNT